eukprot:TRINITY_DN5507_c0_g1_i1.p1 TRINITY_DN5507_c0_g1~~TRINITY_DN5507_c0_g1_i1.p1  ORF type:complete len:720 (+),score=166.07 TRINITY_DN5507_c0_g1_i1:342-2501(+)
MSSFGSLKEGYLTKEGRLITSWKRRLFVLQHNVLYYFKNIKSMTSSGSIHMNLIIEVRPLADPAGKKPGEYFEIVTIDRVYCVMAETKDERKEWMEAIEAVRSFYLVWTAVQEVMSRSGDTTGRDLRTFHLDKDEDGNIMPPSSSPLSSTPPGSPRGGGGGGSSSPRNSTGGGSGGSPRSQRFSINPSAILSSSPTSRATFSFGRLRPSDAGSSPRGSMRISGGGDLMTSSPSSSPSSSSSGSPRYKSGTISIFPSSTSSRLSPDAGTVKRGSGTFPKLAIFSSNSNAAKESEEDETIFGSWGTSSSYKKEIVSAMYNTNENLVKLIGLLKNVQNILDYNPPKVPNMITPPRPKSCFTDDELEDEKEKIRCDIVSMGLTGVVLCTFTLDYLSSPFNYARMERFNFSVQRHLQLCRRAIMFAQDTANFAAVEHTAGKVCTNLDIMNRLTSFGRPSISQEVAWGIKAVQDLVTQAFDAPDEMKPIKMKEVDVIVAKFIQSVDQLAINLDQDDAAVLCSTVAQLPKDVYAIRNAMKGYGPARDSKVAITTSVYFENKLHTNTINMAKQSISNTLLRSYEIVRAKEPEAPGAGLFPVSRLASPDLGSSGSGGGLYKSSSSSSITVPPLTSLSPSPLSSSEPSFSTPPPPRHHHHYPHDKHQISPPSPTYMIPSSSSSSVATRESRALVGSPTVGPREVHLRLIAARQHSMSNPDIPKKLAFSP